MDLTPLLTRAESLFRRFERTVQAIDKKNNFPLAPTAHQRKPSGTNAKGKSPQTNASAASSSALDMGGAVPADGDDNETRVISPELRMLLRRDIPWRRQVRVEQQRLS